MAKEHRLAVCAPNGVALRYWDLIVPFSGFQNSEKSDKKVANIQLSLVKGSPAGMEPAGAARHRQSPKGERMGNVRVNRTKVRNNHLVHPLQKERGSMSPAGIEPTFKV